MLTTRFFAMFIVTYSIIPAQGKDEEEEKTPIGITGHRAGGTKNCPKKSPGACAGAFGLFKLPFPVD
ncbi:hypothetical protein AGMMS50255_2320 [Spirochaetia bacterium]|nr:hypothetical protein AGMMS50255_2320 [Spirochaetia bacterium]